MVQTQLRDDLRCFSKTYHTYLSTCKRLEDLADRYRTLQSEAPDDYYYQCDASSVKASKRALKQVEALRSKLESLKCRQEENAAALREEAEIYHKIAISNETIQLEKWKMSPGKTVLVVFGLIMATEFAGIILSIFTTVLNPLFPIAIIVVPAVYLVKKKHGWDRRRAESQRAYEQIAEEFSNEQRLQNESLIKIATEIGRCETQFQTLQPIAEKLKANAIIQAEYLLGEELSKISDQISIETSNKDALHERLINLGTVPSEADWSATNYLLNLVESNRAETLKEALRIYDADKAARKQNQQENERQEALLKKLDETVRQANETNQMLQEQYEQVRRQNEQLLNSITQGLSGVKNSLGSIAENQKKQRESLMDLGSSAEGIGGKLEEQLEFGTIRMEEQFRDLNDKIGR